MANEQSNRERLKSHFQRFEIPSQEDFEDLINTAVIPEADGTRVEGDLILEEKEGGGTGVVHASDFEFTQFFPAKRFNPFGKNAGDRFGSSVAISGDTAIVGARHNDDNGPQAGAAYIFQYNGNRWEEMLGPLLGKNASDQFGSSVAISGDTAIVGAPLNNNDNGLQAGAAYIFQYNRNRWEEMQSLFGSNSQDQFGTSVAISGDTAIVGAPYNDGKGAVYIFQYNGTGWEEMQSLFGSNSQDQFGTSVAISGDTAIVGAPYNDGKGAVYIFQYNGTGWEEMPGPLLGKNGGDRFGSSVAISGDTAIVGAPLDNNVNGVDAGAAYIFQYNGNSWEEMPWPLLGKNVGDGFGSSVAISGDTAIVGASHNDDNGPQAGAAYLFRYNGTGWKEIPQPLLGNNSQDQFGISVAISGDTAIVGAWLNDDNGNSAGAAHIFQMLSGIKEILNFLFQLI